MRAPSAVKRLAVPLLVGARATISSNGTVPCLPFVKKLVEVAMVVTQVGDVGRRRWEVCPGCVAVMVVVVNGWLRGESPMRVELVLRICWESVVRIGLRGGCDPWLLIAGVVVVRMLIFRRRRGVTRVPVCRCPCGLDGLDRGFWLGRVPG